MCSVEWPSDRNCHPLSHTSLCITKSQPHVRMKPLLGCDITTDALTRTVLKSCRCIDTWRWLDTVERYISLYGCTTYPQPPPPHTHGCEHCGDWGWKTQWGLLKVMTFDDSRPNTNTEKSLRALLWLASSDVIWVSVAWGCRLHVWKLKNPKKGKKDGGEEQARGERTRPLEHALPLCVMLTAQTAALATIYLTRLNLSLNCWRFELHCGQCRPWFWQE